LNGSALAVLVEFDGDYRRRPAVSLEVAESPQAGAGTVVVGLPV
jgi:hypothetical protein